MTWGLSLFGPEVLQYIGIVGEGMKIGFKKAGVKR